MNDILKCPYCNSTAQPNSVKRDYDVTTVLILYCASCSSILGAADFRPHYPDLTGPHASP